MNSFSFQVEAKKGWARAGLLHLAHGVVPTPIFMPVGTVATVKALDTQDIEMTKAAIILANTYHLYLRPGMERLKKQGGLHKFMGWDSPILTDSGGFQVFSLGEQQARNGGKSWVKVNDDGVEFKSHLDGSKHFFTPEKAISIQQDIGADIIMAFDQCTAGDADVRAAQAALQRTTAWAARCVSAWEKSNRLSTYGSYQALFGIVQGAKIKELRQQALADITALNFDGIALGGRNNRL